MTGFRFRLATVLKLRERTRDERRAELASAYAAEFKLRERRQAVERELAELIQSSGQAAVGTINVNRLLAGSRFDAILRAEIHVINQHQQTLAVEIEKRAKPWWRLIAR